PGAGVRHHQIRARIPSVLPARARKRARRVEPRDHGLEFEADVRPQPRLLRAGRHRGRHPAHRLSNPSRSEKPVRQAARPRILRALGPGLITGASDDDPSGIATYTQTGAQFGYGMAWTLLFSYPLMAAIQIISARIGRTTGAGIAG